MLQARLRVDDIAITPSGFDPFQYVCCFQLSYQSQYRALGDADVFCDVAQACARVGCQTHENVCMVAEEAPGGG